MFISPSLSPLCNYLTSFLKMKRIIFDYNLWLFSVLSVYLLLGLVCVLVVMETFCELPQLRRFRQKFYQENVRDLDSETTNIIDRDHMSEQLAETADHMSPSDPQTVITSVSEQAETMRHNGTSIPYIPPSASAVNWELTSAQPVGGVSSTFYFKGIDLWTSPSGFVAQDAPRL